MLFDVYVWYVSTHVYNNMLYGIAGFLSGQGLLDGSVERGCAGMDQGTLTELGLRTPLSILNFITEEKRRLGGIRVSTF